MRACVLRTEDLSIGYGSRCVAEGISLQLEEGRILCLIGLFDMVIDYRKRYWGKKSEE